MPKIHLRAETAPRKTMKGKNPGAVTTFALLLVFSLLFVNQTIRARAVNFKFQDKIIFAGNPAERRDLSPFRFYEAASAATPFETLFHRMAANFDDFSPASVYVVNSTLDTSDAAPGNNVCDDGMGRCTLRAAIQEANAHAGADVINFSIASGLQTINVGSDLPIITEQVTLDATTQAGYAGVPIIQVTGVSSAFGFDVTSGGTIIRGFILNRWNTAIQFDAAGGNVVENCYIGTDANGSIAVANGDGIVVRSNNNRIGGTSAAARNVISGNSRVGVSINGGDNNAVQGNYIGTNFAGTATIAGLPPSPTNIGIEIIGGNFNTVGGTASGAGNVVSGNRDGNIVVRRFVPGGATTDANTIQGNFIGTNAAGTGATSDNTRGIFIDSATNTTVGGASAAARNLISGHFGGLVSGGAIWIVGGANATGTIIQGNYIGTDAAGNSSLINSGAGILTAGDNTRIGGTAGGAGNLISGNSGSGVRILSSNNTVEGNFIGTNAAGNADLGNNLHGVLIENGTNNAVGGGNADARNLISGNNQNGVLISSPAATNNISGNLIGTDIFGNADLGNSLNGVRIDNSPSNTVGSAFAQNAVNTISGNDGNGVVISGAGATNNQILGNRIGTNSAGTAALQNAQIGVTVGGGASSNKIGDLTLTPGAAPGNLISGQIGPTNGIGVRISGAGTRLNTVFGNLIGTNANGVSAIPNQTGVLIDFGATQNFIGEKLPNARNIISGNTSTGVLIAGSGTNDNQAQNNLIGTDINGALPLGNSNAGVQISSAAAGNIIGGTLPGSRNIISATKIFPGFPATGQGVFISFNATGNFVQGNYIGTDAGGSAALQNETEGVKIENASGNLIGGAQAGARNVISGNGASGILITNNANNNLIQNNAVGLKADGSPALPNNGDGVRVSLTDGASSVPNGNAVAGTSASEANVIAFNTGKGVLLQNALNTSLLSNSIFSNAALGIDLFDASGEGVTANDACDADAGANLLQNYPTIVSATNSGGVTLITGNLDGAASANFTVQIFVNDACDASGFGEGQTLLESFTVTTDAMCQKSFARTYSPEVPVGKYITATATDAAGNTSEFSACRPVTIPTAAHASVSGRVTTADGRGIRNARLVLSDAFGQSRHAQTGAFGYFRFTEIPVGATYVLTVSSKRFVFAQPSQVINLTDDLTDVNFTSEP
jgi:CSLREA domain-containing protein